MDHSPDVVLAQPGAEGHRLHGGMIPFNPAGYYLCRAGQIHCGCVVVAWQLCDCRPGDGGLVSWLCGVSSHYFLLLCVPSCSLSEAPGWQCTIPGTHKNNFDVPMAMRTLEKHTHFVREMVANRGDVIIFPEAVRNESAA